jgi:hypothetical protein
MRNGFANQAERFDELVLFREWRIQRRCRTLRACMSDSIASTAWARLHALIMKAMAEIEARDGS